MDSATTAGLDALVDETLARGSGSAVAALVLVDGEVAYERHAGTVRAWHSARHPVLHPTPPVDASTRFDLASLTKPIVAAALLAELHARAADAGTPVAEVLPEFRSPELRGATIGSLLTHTAGFAAEWHDRRADPEGVRFRRGARPIRRPGDAYEYSCVGYIWAGLALEALAARPLGEAVTATVLRPLGMPETGFRPTARHRDGTAATEWQPGRGLVHGDVHDETSWSLGGATGNAGLFGTAHDVARFAEALRTSGPAPGLPEPVRRALITPTGLPADPGYGQALGPRVGEAWTRALGPGAVSHTGFTGTAFATRPGGRCSLVFLTNGVHPARTSNAAAELRGRFADLAAPLGGS